MRDFAKSVTMSHTWNHRLQSLWDLYWESLQSETSLQVILPSSALVGKFNWTWAELALLSVFPSSDPTLPDPTRPDLTRPDPTRPWKVSKHFFTAKLALYNLFYWLRWLHLEDNLNLFSKWKTTSTFFQWKTTSIFFKWNTTSIFYK